MNNPPDIDAFVRNLFEKGISAASMKCDVEMFSLNDDGVDHIAKETVRIFAVRSPLAEKIHAIIEKEICHDPKP
jgi:hypothetical protein